MLIDLDLLDIFCKLNGPCCGLSKSLGLEHDNGDDGLFVPINKEGWTEIVDEEINKHFWVCQLAD